MDGVGLTKEKKYNAIEKENNRLNETIEKVEKSKINKINQPKKIINECIIQNSQLVNIDSKVANVSKSICKIKITFKNNKIQDYEKDSDNSALCSFILHGS